MSVRHDEYVQVDFLFDGAPSYPSPGFIDTVLTDSRDGCGVGKWVDLGDGMWALRTWVMDFDIAMQK